MSLVEKNSTSFSLHSGSTWSSFEKFRTEGAKALHTVKNGTVGTLQTKNGHYRILEEQDFQTLLGLANEAERLQGGLRVVVHAIRVAQKHPDTDSLNLLAQVVTMLGNLPEVPRRSGFPPLDPEGLDVDPNDEVILDRRDGERKPLDSSMG